MITIRFGYCPPNPRPKAKLRNKWFTNVKDAIKEYKGETIYTKKHFWNKWEQRNTYADYNVAEREAERMKKVPKYF